MFAGNLKLAFRNLRIAKANSIINILGLGTASAAFLLLMQYVSFEKSYEDSHSRADRIQRVTLDLYNGPEKVGTDCETYPPLGPALKKQYPEVEDYVRIQDVSPIEVKYRDKVFALDKLYAADPSVFSVFDYKMVSGIANTALDKPMQVVLTRKIAARIFGEEPAMGKTIYFNTFPVTVSGVIEDVPLNSHLRFEVLLSFNSLASLGTDTASWKANNNYLYLLTKPGVSAAAMGAKAHTFAKAHPDLKKEDLIVQNIREIHLHSKKSFEPDINGDNRTVNFLVVVAVIIVIIGSINYINLITATSSERSKQSGMRRLLGSSRMALIGQFLTETLLINLLGLGFAVLLIQLVFPMYETLTDKKFPKHILLDNAFWFRILILFVVNAILSGFYPALVLSGVKPVVVLRRTFTQSASGNFLRKGLVVTQFAVAIVVLIASVVVYRQVSFMRDQDLGMNISQTMVLRGPMNAESDSVHLNKVHGFLSQLATLSMVKMVSVSGAVPGNDVHQMNTTTGIVQYGSNLESGLNYCSYNIDENFLPLMQMEIAAGRNFRPGNSNAEVLINEESSRLLGFKNPAAAIGQKITYGGRGQDHSVVVGVIKDYKQRSVKDAMLPMIHRYSKSDDSYYSIKLNTASLGNTISIIEKNWKQHFPDNSFEYFFLDDLFDQQYRADLRFGNIIAIFSGLTFFITCLGILGLTAATITRRTREIGIRKVLGASVPGIVTLISREFLKLVCIAIIIGSPVAWLLMNEWLKDFNTRINIAWWIFAAAGALALTVAIVTISFQAIKAAIANPVDSLKSE